ncbi:DUF445 domain-containing protein [Effusibacillus lacus]|nr:DUF445 family protein [Effusibacillus lacus]
MTLLLMTIAVGAAIGFGTNLLAILMLFRPWRERRLFGVKLPFTPGLIPKRQPEIAHKLGEVVEEHLLTKEGILSTISRPEWASAMSGRILEWIETVLAEDRTLRGLWSRVTGQTALEIADQLEKWALTSKPIRDLLPDAVQNRIAVQIGTFAESLLEKGQAWLDSQSAREFLIATIQDRLTGGGMFGKLAVMFIQEEKLADEIVPHLKNFLANPATLRFIQDKFLEEWQTLLNRNAGEAVSVLVNKSVDVDLYELFENHRPAVIGFLDKLLLRVQQSSGIWVSPILHSLDIKRIVEEQVSSFPIPKFEKLVFDVVQRELKMITWLGAFLGGLIGLIQALFIMGWQ